MTVRTSILLLPTVITPIGGAAYYTCPAGRTAILKGISVVNAHSAAVTSNMAIRRSGLNNYWMWLRSFALGSSEWFDRWIVLEPGDQWWITASVAGVLVVGGFGTELDGVAP